MTTYEIDAFPLEGMMATDFYAINLALRDGDDIDRQCGPYLDLQGWRSMREFLREVALMFYGLWKSGAMGEHAGEIGFRGCILSPSEVSEYLEWGYIYDSGYSFASPNRESAVWHADISEENLHIKRISKDCDYNNLVPVLLEIEMGRSSIYIPAANEPDPHHLRRGDMANSNREGQYILDHHSLLKITQTQVQNRVQIWRCKQVM